MQKIARVLRSDGTEGGVLLGFQGVSPDEIDLKEPVFIYDDGLPVPYFISNLVRKGQSKAVCRLTGLRTLADSEELVGRELWADWDDEVDGDDPAALEGWTVLSETGATVGTVTGYEDIPGNLCLYVDTPGGEVLLPFHEDLLISADPDTATLILRIPEGLL